MMCAFMYKLKRSSDWVIMRNYSIPFPPGGYEGTSTNVVSPSQKWGMGVASDVRPLARHPSVHILFAKQI